MATLQKKYVYQVYSNGNAYLGTLKNVKSEFNYTQNINAGGAQLMVELSNAFEDIGTTQSSDGWIDESGNRIVDESGNRIVWASNYSFANIPLGLGNHVKVFVSYDGATSGRQVFDGFISQWETDFNDNTIKVTVLSYGAQLDNYLINTDPTGQVIDQELYNKEYAPSVSGDKNNILQPVAQSFNIASATTIGSFIVFARGTDGDFIDTNGGTVSPLALLSWSLYSGTPATPGALIDGGTVSFVGTYIRQLTLGLTKPLSLSGNYYLVLYNSSGTTRYYTSPIIEASSANPYSGGTVYTGNTVLGVTTWTQVAADDLAFIVVSSTGNNTLVFSNNDPGTIMQRIVAQIANQGSSISYTTSSIDITTTSASYTYKIQTALEAVNKLLQLSPSGWYWYLDVATSVLHFHRTANSATHRLIFKRHLKDFNLQYTLEQVINTVYFSGGPTSGVNLYVASKNAVSAAAYGQWIEKLSDNRVTDNATAQLIMAGELGTKGSPAFRANIDVLAADYDIELFKPGDTLVVRGINTLVDSLLFQIVTIKRTPDVATLTIGTLLPRVSSELDSVRRRLDLLETIANPSAPS